MTNPISFKITVSLAAGVMLSIGCAGQQTKSNAESSAGREAAENQSVAKQSGANVGQEQENKQGAAKSAWKTPSGWYYKESFGKGNFVHMPVCVAADQDRVIVLDSTGAHTDKNTQVLIFDNNMKLQAKVEVPLGTGEARPHGLAIAPDGTIYLGIDSMDGDNQVAGLAKVVSSGQNYTYEYLGQVDRAVAEYGIATDENGKVYLTDAGTNRIITDALGVASSFKGPGDTEDYPTRGLAVEPGSRTLLTHTMKGGTFKLVRYSINGKLLKEMAISKVAERLPWYYDEIDVAPDGRIFVTDYGNRKVLVLGKDGGLEASLTCDSCRGPVSSGSAERQDIRSRLSEQGDPRFRTHVLTRNHPAPQVTRSLSPIHSPQPS